MQGRKIDKITIKGFKSIRELVDFELRDLNVIVGANGAGKSNFIQVFKMLRAMASGALQDYVVRRGGANALFFNGVKQTPQIDLSVGGFTGSLVPTADDRVSVLINGNQPVSELSDFSADWMVYHFQDATELSAPRRSEIVEHAQYLCEDGGNVAPFLMRLQNGDLASRRSYKAIIDAVRLVMPFFDDFQLNAMSYGPAEKVKLSWRQKGSDYPFQPYHFSDGSLRFICLATALLQPRPPSLIVLDEPELGLHPLAIDVVSEMVKAAASRSQLVVATQSPALVDQFSFKDMIVAGRQNGATVFERLNEADFSCWMDDYTIGELWRDNVIQGGPAHE